MLGFIEWLNNQSEGIKFLVITPLLIFFGGIAFISVVVIFRYFVLGL